MATILNVDTVEISGTPTINEVVASGLYTRTQGAVLEQQYHTKLMDGADLTFLKGLIFDLNGKNFQPQTAGSCPEVSGIGFIHNGDTGNGGESNQWLANNLNLKDCIIFNRSSKATFGIELADNLTVSCSYNPTDTGNTTDAGAGMAPFLVRGGLFSGINLYYIFRFGLAGFANATPENRFHLKGIRVQTSGQFLVGYNSAPESIWEDCEWSGNSSFFMDTFENTRENNLVLLGANTIDSFFDGGTTFTRTSPDNNFRCYTGGKRYLNIINGNGMKFTSWATINSVFEKQPIVVTRDVDHLLSDDFIGVSSDNENIEATILTGIWDPGGTYGGSGLVNYTDISLLGVKYGKKPYIKTMTQAEAEAVSGSSLAYSPLAIEDDENITEGVKATVDAYTEIEILEKFHDGIQAYLEDNATPNLYSLLTVNSQQLIMRLDWSVLVKKDATSVFAVNVATKLITIKATALVGGAKFTNIKCQGTGTVTADTDEDLTGIGIEDANGNAAVTLLQTVTGDTLELSTDNKTSWAAVGTNYRYTAASVQTIVYFRRTQTDGSVLIRLYDIATTGIGNELVMGYGALETINKEVLDITFAETTAWAKKAADNAEQANVKLN